MRRFRFHIGTLLILVLILGVGFAALRESDETWDSSIFSLTLGVLLISILLAVHRLGVQESILAWVRCVRVGIRGAVPCPIDRVPG